MEFRTLWQGHLVKWMDEGYISELWAQVLKTTVEVKVIRDRLTGISLGYGFVRFDSLNMAQKAMELDGTVVMKQLKLKLNWASGNNGENGDEYSIFVGDLCKDVTDEDLQALFKAKYESVRSAKVVLDSNVASKGYGFVRFGSEEEQKLALVEMNGQFCGKRAMRVSLATPKVRSNHFKYSLDPYNTTVFVGGLDPIVTEVELAGHFSTFGRLVYIKIPENMGCGFVSFQHREEAEMAIDKMQGVDIAGSRVRLAWGNSLPSPYYSVYNNNVINPVNQTLCDEDKTQVDDLDFPKLNKI